MGKTFTDRWQTALRREAQKVLPADQQEAFIAAVAAGNAAQSVIVRFRDFEVPPESTIAFPFADQDLFAASDASLFTQLPEHESGCFYMLDGGSVFMAQSFASLPAATIKTCYDLCAAPGGKTALLCHYLQPERLIANEVVKKRLSRLRSNVSRCELKGVECISIDPESLVEQGAEAADLVVVDAPCSGQALFARGETSSGAFTKHTIQMNMKRQRRILAAATRLVRPGGYLCYMTCTYSIPENEKNVEWLAKNFADFYPEVVTELEGYQSALTDLPSYRLWPQQGHGTGGFTVRFRRCLP